MMLLISLTGAFAQFIDGVLGMGYGVSAATMLTALGLAPAVISATVHAAKLPSTAVSALSHGREGNVDRTITLPLSLGGMIGGVAGALLLSHLASGDIRPFVALVLLLLGARMLFCALLGRQPLLGAKLSRERLAFVGVVGGALDAFGGGGWGPTCTSVLMNGDGREPRRLIGSVNAAEVATTAAIVITLALRLGGEAFAWGTAIPLIVGGVIAAPFAARVCSGVDSRILKAGVGATLVALNAAVLAGALGAEWLKPALWVVAATIAVAVSGYTLWQRRVNVVEA